MKTHSSQSGVVTVPLCSGVVASSEPADFSFHSEFSAAKFGDQRLTARVAHIADRALRCPESSIPTFLGGPRQAGALYRFVANPKVTPALVVQPHINNTVLRCAPVGCVIIASDSSTHGYGNDSKRKGLGRTVAGGLGFILHGSIAIDESTGKLLGLLHHSTWVRPLPKPDNEPPVSGAAGAAAIVTQGAEPAQKAEKAKGKSSKPRKMQDDPSNESARWLNHALKSGKLLGKKERVHVADREADDFKYFSGLVQAGESFVSRVNSDRVLADGVKLFVKMQGMVVKMCRLVMIDHHKPSVGVKAQKTHPARESRQAKLQVIAGTIEIPRPSHAPRSTPLSLKLNFVLVEEVEVAAGNTPVIWRLVTDLPVSTAEEIARVVDIYRMRWVIEEYWKALKSGCAFSSHQLESYSALTKLLAILLVVAWKLLEIRTIAREHPNLPAEVVLTKRQVKCLQVLHNKEHPKTPLPNKPTVKEALWAIAGLGGHFKHNGEPGWQTLGRGLRRLLQAEQDGLALLAVLSESRLRTRSG